MAAKARMARAKALVRIKVVTLRGWGVEVASGKGPSTINQKLSTPSRPNGPGHGSPGRRAPTATVDLGKSVFSPRAIGAGQPLSRPFRAWARSGRSPGRRSFLALPWAILSRPVGPEEMLIYVEPEPSTFNFPLSTRAAPRSM